jgi:hypothetical protein
MEGLFSRPEAVTDLSDSRTDRSDFANPDLTPVSEERLRSAYRP